MGWRSNPGSRDRHSQGDKDVRYDAGASPLWCAGKSGCGELAGRLPDRRLRREAISSLARWMGSLDRDLWHAGGFDSWFGRAGHVEGQAFGEAFLVLLAGAIEGVGATARGHRRQVGDDWRLAPRARFHATVSRYGACPAGNSGGIV
jgi:hypothetical protein